MALDILELRKLCIPKNIRITLHAAKRLESHSFEISEIHLFFSFCLFSIATASSVKGIVR